jgi:hypothetical protein
LIVDQELGALVDPPLVPHPVELFQDHGLQRGAVGGRQGLLQELLEKLLERGARLGAGVD